MNNDDDTGDQKRLFPKQELRAVEDSEPKVLRIEEPIWTENKAKLIERYLYYFVQITHHGAYIDGFAGPQSRARPDTWAAKLVLDSEPRWLRHFYLCDQNARQVKSLNELKTNQPSRDAKGRKIARKIEVLHGDFNEVAPRLLDSDVIGQAEATFCLLDQRTFECHWQTVKRIAEYKAAGQHKVELFYFLGVGWLGRACAALKNDEILKAWWGRDDWAAVRGWNSNKLTAEFRTRLKKDLGYRSVKPWPIYETRTAKGTIMYYMLHAADHPDAPKLMSRAYRRAVLPKESLVQLRMDLAAQKHESEDPE